MSQLLHHRNTEHQNLLLSTRISRLGHKHFPFSNHPFLRHPGRAAWHGAMDHGLNCLAGMHQLFKSCDCLWCRRHEGPVAIRLLLTTRMLRHWWGEWMGGWGELARMVNATILRNCWGGWVDGWVGGILTFVALAQMLNASQLLVLGVGCQRSLHLHTCSMHVQFDVSSQVDRSNTCRRMLNEAATAIHVEVHQIKACKIFNYDIKFFRIVFRWFGLPDRNFQKLAPNSSFRGVFRDPQKTLEATILWKFQMISTLHILDDVQITRGP